MDRMVDEWEPMRIETKQYRDTAMSVMMSVDDIQTMLDDQIVKTQTMRGSPFIKPFEERIKVSQLKCMYTAHCTLCIFSVHVHMYMYLYCVISSL